MSSLNASELVLLLKETQTTLLLAFVGIFLARQKPEVSATMKRSPGVAVLAQNGREHLEYIRT